MCGNKLWIIKDKNYILCNKCYPLTETSSKEHKLLKESVNTIINYLIKNSSLKNR